MMDKKSQQILPRVYFLGSGNIAVSPLDKLCSSLRIELVGAGTQPDKPAGRKHRLHPTPVGRWAASKNIEVDKPESVNNPDFIDRLRALRPDIVFVASFGQLLRTPLLELPAAGCINLHASLLPAYRGAAPIASAILDGIGKTGITFMKMDKGLDTGPVYCAYEQTITDENALQLEEKLGILGAEHIEEVIENIFSGNLTPEEQDHKKATYAAKIKKQDGQLNWNETAECICRRIRAFHPWPGVSFVLESLKGPLRIMITEAETISALNEVPGTNIQADKNRWIIACGSGGLILKKVKPEGKGEMSGSEFIRGRPEMFKAE